MKNSSNITKVNNLILIFYCFLILIISTLGFFFAFLSPTGLFTYFIALFIIYLGNKSALKISNGSNIDKLITYSSFILPIIPVLGLFGVGYNYTKYIRLKTKKYLIFSLIGLIFILIIWSIGLSGIDFASLIKDNQTLLKVCTFISSMASYKFYEKTLKGLKNDIIENKNILKKKVIKKSNKPFKSIIIKNKNIILTIIFGLLITISLFYIGKNGLPIIEFDSKSKFSQLSFEEKEKYYSSCNKIYRDKDSGYSKDEYNSGFFYSISLDTCIWKFEKTEENIYGLYDMLEKKIIYKGNIEGYKNKIDVYR